MRTKVAVSFASILMTNLEKVRQCLAWEHILRQAKHFVVHNFIRGKERLYQRGALRLPRTNFSNERIQKRLKEFQKHLGERRISTEFNRSFSLSEIHFENRKEALQQKPTRGKTILPLSRNINHQSLPVKNILMKHWREPPSSKTDLPRTWNYIAQKRKVSKTLRIKSYKHVGRRRESGLSSLYYKYFFVTRATSKTFKIFCFYNIINFRLKDTLLLWTTQ